MTRTHKFSRLTVGLWSHPLKQKESDIYNGFKEPFMDQTKNFFRKFPLTGPPKTAFPSKFCNM
jgi:hypothetical protein